MADISLEAVTGKLNRLGFEAFNLAHRQAKGAGNRNIELAHWLAQILQKDRSDLALTCAHFKLDNTRLAQDLLRAMDGFGKNVTSMPGISQTVIDMLDRGWHYATLFFGETQIRSGHILVGALKDVKLRREILSVSAEFNKINADVLSDEHRKIWQLSEEENMRPIDGSGLVAAGTPGAETAAGAKGTTALDRFSQDLTAKAKAGEMDAEQQQDEAEREGGERPGPGCRAEGG